MADTQRTLTDLLTNLFQDGQADGSITEQDMRDLIVSLVNPYMGFYISTSAVTTISASGTYYKAAGTTTETNSSSDMDDNGGTNNRIRYTGLTTRHFHIVAQASVTLATGTNQDVGIQVWKYDDSAGSGSLLAHSEARNYVPHSEAVQITTHADTMLDTNDYIEIHVANHTDTNNVELNYGYMFAMGNLM